MKLVVNRISWISFYLTKILSTQHPNITGNNLVSGPRCASEGQRLKVGQTIEGGRGLWVRPTNRSQWEKDQVSKSIEINNRVRGRLLQQQRKRTGTKTYPFLDQHLSGGILLHS